MAKPWSSYKASIIHDARHLRTRLRTDGIKAMSRVSLGGKQVINFSNTRNRSRVFLWQQKMNNFFLFKTIMANYGWKWSLLLFFNAVVTVDVLTASNNDVNFVETQTVRFAWRLNRCFVLRELTKSTAMSRIGKFYLLFASWNTTWHCFHPVNPKGRAKIASIVNKVYCDPEAPNSVPALTTSWICSLYFRV